MFICTGNAGRSQIAERLFRQLAGESAVVMSAGVAPWDHLHPMAVRLMQERGLAITGQSPKSVDSLAHQPWDVVVTIGDPARDRTPELAGNPRRMHWPVSDPADADSSGPAAQAAAFRVTIAEIEQRLPEVLDLVTLRPTARQLHLAPGLSTLYAIPDRGHLAFDADRQIPALAQAGFRCLEFNGYFGSSHYSWDVTERLQHLARLAADHHLAINSFHAIREYVTVADARARRRMIDLTKANADAAAMLGTAIVVIHAGLPAGVERSRGEAILYETIAELADHALTMPCRFGWENGAPGLTAGEHLAWIRKFNPGSLGFVLDAGHAHVDRNLDDYLGGAGLRLAGLHLHDNHGNKDEHLLPGRGAIDWDHFMAGLAQTGYMGPLMLEACNGFHGPDQVVPGFLKEAMAALQRLREK
ncbi:MAG: TIM barrel protein [Kiritimatiellae bacterium]|nr:TIM barrel protein [Kiritimatiellia bacterium]